MEWMNLAAIGGLFGGLVMFWNNIKALAMRVTGLLLQRVEVIDTMELTAPIVAYLNTHFQRTSTYDRKYGVFFDVIRGDDPKDDEPGGVVYEAFGYKPIIYWCGWRPLFVSRRAPADNTNDTTRPGSEAHTVYGSLHFTYLRGTLDFDRLVRDSLNRFHQEKIKRSRLSEKINHRFFIHRIPEDLDHQRNALGGGAYTFSSREWCEIGLWRQFHLPPDKIGERCFANKSQLDLLCFPPEVDQVVAEVRRWRDSRDWYIDRGLPWKRGLLLYGPPGTGKSALVRALGFDLNLPIYAYNLAELDNGTFAQAWKRMSGPAIALVEDIDSVFKGRENIVPRRLFTASALFRPRANNDAPAGRGEPQAHRDDWRDGEPLTFDCLLNLLDGVGTNHGILTIVTTNRLDHIDPALGTAVATGDGQLEFASTRPGRIDRAVHLTYMRLEEKLRMAKRILQDMPEAYAEMAEFFLTRDVDETPAQVQERLARKALDHYWSRSLGKPAPITRPQLMICHGGEREEAQEELVCAGGN